jgi:excinuclease ABC subunit A
MSGQRHIALRGVCVHNLKSIDLDIPHRRLIVVCGVSGSGKSSLAFDTLYAEGQRRYIESFSAYTRQFLERLERPAAERIDGMPPAVAVAQGGVSRSNRSTVGTATEINDYLRLLFARIGRVHCPRCGRPVRRDGPQAVADWARGLPQGTRFLVAFPVGMDEGTAGEALEAEAKDRPAIQVDGPWAALREQGFQRVIAGGRTWDLATESPPADLAPPPGDASSVAQAFMPGTAEPPPHPAINEPVHAVVDRLTGGVAVERLRDSLETAFARGDGRCVVFVEDGANKQDAGMPGGPFTLDGRPWRRHAFSTRLRCDDCGIDYPDPEPRLFSFNSPLGACPACEGFGNVLDVDLDLVVPDRAKSLREGAIAPWNTPAYAHELQELLALAADYNLPVEVPVADLTEEHWRLIQQGVPERKFGGLDGFFNWLNRRKYKMHIRVFLSRWRSERLCPACGGSRLRPEALAVRVGGRSIAEVGRMKTHDAIAFFGQLDLPPTERTIARVMLDQVQARLGYLESVGLGYLPLDRSLRTLSGGEAQRVALTTALGSSLVNMLYVLDEPSVGLHPHDTRRLIGTITGLRDRQNTVVVVDHDEDVIRAADHVIEIGPGAGDRGGKVVFQGTPAEMAACPTSLTGDYLAGRRVIRGPARRRTPGHGWIRLAGARGHNLRDITVEFPLGVLCVVTGVSGSGKSTLVEETLYPALCRRMRKEIPPACDYDDVFGDGQLNDVMLVDQSPIGRSPRSNPVTYIKAFDEIRAVFAETIEARTRNYTASHFSFNVAGGRCNACEGDGYLRIDMQFLPDVFMKCGQCHGTRYRAEILEARYRGRNIAEVLEMTVREAFTFFRGQAKVQAKLKKLMDVGLDYLRLGQPANTLSGGEAQRLKLAGYVSAARRGRTLFLLDEPTTGLHSFDVVQLIDCFEALLAVGHSLIVVEHNLALIKYADYIIDLGPGAADEGGRVVAHGTPEIVSRNKASITGRYLAQALAAELAEQPA